LLKLRTYPDLGFRNGSLYLEPVALFHPGQDLLYPGHRHRVLEVSGWLGHLVQGSELADQRQVPGEVSWEHFPEGAVG